MNGDVPAPCAGLVDLFYSTAAIDVDEAKRICASCPRAKPCYRGAADRGEKFGVWGGVEFPGGQRAAMRLERERKAS